MRSSESDSVFVTDSLSIVTLTGLGVSNRGGSGWRPEQITTTVRVSNKGGSHSRFVTYGSLNLVTLIGLGQLTATCP